MTTTTDRGSPFGERSDMWQVYLMLANERQTVEQRKTAEQRVERMSLVQGWRASRRAGGRVAPGRKQSAANPNP